MVADRSAPTVAVRVRASGESEPVDVTDRILSLEYEDGEDKADSLKLMVDNHDLAEFDRELWRKGNVLEVAWGYAGALAPARQVIVKKVNGFKRLTVEGVSKSFLLHGVKRTRTFAEVKRSEVVRRVAKEHGFGAERTFIEDTEEIVPTVTQARMTDAQLLATLARREGFEFYVDVDGLHFHKRSVGQKPVRTLRYHDDPAQGDILGIKMKNDLRFKQAGKKVRGRDPIAKKDFEVEVSADQVGKSLAPVVELTEKAVGFGARAVAAGISVGTTGRLGLEPTSELGAGTARRRAAGDIRRQRQLTVELEVQIIGDPDLLAKTIVRILGISSLLSGNYYVQTVRHRVKPGEYVQRLTCIRDGHSEKRDPARLFAEVGGGGGAANQSCEARTIAVIQAVQEVAGILPQYTDALGGQATTVANRVAGLQTAADSLNRDPENPSVVDLDHVIANAAHAEAAAQRAGVSDLRRKFAAIRSAAGETKLRCAAGARAPVVNDTEPADDDDTLEPFEIVDPDTGDTRTVYRDSKGRVVDVGGFNTGAGGSF